MSQVLLVRHGETHWNRERRIQGWAPSRLTDRGHEQAIELGKAIDNTYDVDAIRSSDLRRATETAAHLERAIGIEVEFDPRWRERHFGRCQGLSYEAFAEQFPDLAVKQSGRAAVDAPPEGGEAIRETYDRVIDAWQDLVAAIGSEETVLVVTHSGPLYLLIGRLKGLDPAESLLEQNQPNCALNEITVEDTPRIVCESATDLP